MRKSKKGGYMKHYFIRNDEDEWEDEPWDNEEEEEDEDSEEGDEE